MPPGLLSSGDPVSLICEPMRSLTPGVWKTSACPLCSQCPEPVCIECQFYARDRARCFRKRAIRETHMDVWNSQPRGRQFTIPACLKPFPPLNYFSKSPVTSPSPSPSRPQSRGPRGCLSADGSPPRGPNDICPCSMISPLLLGAYAPGERSRNTCACLLSRSRWAYPWRSGIHQWPCCH